MPHHLNSLYLYTTLKVNVKTDRQTDRHRHTHTHTHTHTYTQTIFQYPKSVRVPHCSTVLAWWRVKMRQLHDCDACCKLTLNVPTTLLSSSKSSPVFLPRYSSNVCNHSLKPLYSCCISSSLGYICTIWNTC